MYAPLSNYCHLEFLNYNYNKQERENYQGKSYKPYEYAKTLTGNIYREITLYCVLSS